MPGYSWNGSAWKKVLRKTMWTGSAWKDIKSSHRWTGSAWETIYSSFMSSGMTKNGIWAPGTTYPWVTISGWTADAGSTVVTDGVRARGTKSDVVVSTQLRIRSTATGGNECAVRLLVGGVVVKTGSLIAFTGGQTQTLTLASDPTPVVADQIATVQIQGQYGRLEVQSGAGSWVRIDNRAPLGMSKNGTAYAATSTFTQVSGMTPDAGSTLSGSALVLNESKNAATISGQVSITDISFGGVGFTVEIRKNGVPVPGASVTDTTYLTKVLTIPTVTTSVTESDQISLWVKLDTTATTVTVTAGSNTYVRIT